LSSVNITSKKEKSEKFTLNVTKTHKQMWRMPGANKINWGELPLKVIFVQVSSNVNR